MEATAPVTVERAAAILRVSASTVHRRIRSGALRAEQASRPQGTVWLVHLPPDAAAATGEPSPPTGPEATAPTGAPAPAEAMVSLIQTTIGTILGPLVAELAASRQTIERQSERLEAQAETIGRQAAELDALRAQNAALDAPGSTERPESTTEPPRAWWRRWRAWLAAGAVLVVLGSASCQVSGSVPTPSPAPRAAVPSLPFICTAASAHIRFWENQIRDIRVSGTDEELGQPVFSPLGTTQQPLDWSDMGAAVMIARTYCDLGPAAPR